MCHRIMNKPMVEESETALPPPSAAESDHDHCVEEKTAVEKPFNESKEVRRKSKEILCVADMLMNLNY